MATSVKNKIRFGTFFLFVLLLLCGGLGIYNLITLKSAAQIILKDNYESLDYCDIILRQLDSLEINRNQALRNFEEALKKEEKNITEPGEGEAANSLRRELNQLKAGNISDSVLKSIHQQIHVILTVNMTAIQRKNLRTEKRAEHALTYLSLIAGIIFLVAFTFTYNFPSVLTNPIGAITEGIREISQKNYKHRIRIKNRDEFGQMADAFNTMAERLEYFENSNISRLMFEKSRAEAVINSLKDASIGIDKNGVVLFANNEALELLSLNVNDIVGHFANEVSQRNDLLASLLNEKNTVPFKIVVRDRENYFTKEMYEVKQGDIKNTVVVVKNITSFKELDVAKTNFIATISHELKTPLAASDFSLKLLEDSRNGKLNKDQVDLVQNLKQNNQRMLKILSELLNMSQVETGKIQLNIKPVDPGAIAESAISTATTAANNKSIQIQKEFANRLPKIEADAEKTGWVLNNFLSNAIKYSEVGSVILVKIVVAENYAQFSVKDQGPGIAEEYASRIFDRFFKIPGSDESGSGLGLAISKEFIEAQNGKIWVISQKEKGSLFGFDLPLTESNPDVG